VDSRVVSDSAAWAQQKDVQRGQVMNQVRQQRVREFLTNLRANAKIEDRRKEVEVANRQLAQ